MATIDRTATMTSNSLPSPNVASASNEGSGAAYQAFDKAGPEWIANTTTGWLKYNFGSQLWAATGYGITPQDPTRAPKDWTFEGSNNDSTWTTLDTQTGVTTWSTGVEKSYTFSNGTKYQYYRLNITANNGSGTNLEIDELTILAPDNETGAFFHLF